MTKPFHNPPGSYNPVLGRETVAQAVDHAGAEHYGIRTEDFQLSQGVILKLDSARQIIKNNAQYCDPLELRKAEYFFGHNYLTNRSNFEMRQYILDLSDSICAKRNAARQRKW